MCYNYCMREARRIHQVRNKAYAGRRGVKRKRFCLAYRETLTRVLAKAADGFLSDIEQKGEKLSCVKGCAYCCSQHISVPVAHAIAVVDFLYSNDRVMDRFLRNYEVWRKPAEGLSAEIDAVYNSALVPSQSWSYAESAGEVLRSRYFSLQIPCPFLVDSSCIIYDVRPVCCAAHCSVSPREWCSPSDTHDIHTYEATPDNRDLHELVKLAPLRLSMVHATLPVMVYRILTEDLAGILDSIDQEYPAETAYFDDGTF